MIVVVRPGANQRDLVHDPRHPRQQLADLRAGNVARDRPIDSANFLGRFGLEIEAIVMRQPAAEIDEDDRACPRFAPVRRLLRFEQLRRQVLPFAEARGYLTDEDVARTVS